MSEDCKDTLPLENSNTEPLMGTILSKRRKMTHAIIDIVDDPVGDIVIRVGTDGDARLVRAHKNVLVMSSPILKTLLTSQNPHNVRKRIYTADDPLLLQADEPAAFVDLCNILHQQATGTQEVPLHRLPAVAIVAHKYGCAERIRSSISLPLHTFFGPDPNADMRALNIAGLSMLDAICIAYVAGDAKLFARATRRAMVQFDHNWLSQIPENGLAAVLPKSVFDRLLLTRETELRFLEDAAHEAIVKIYEQTPLRNPCQEAKERVGLLSFHMCKVKQGKRDFSMTAMSLESVWAAMTSVAEIVGAPTSTLWGCTGDFPGCSSGGCRVDVQSTLRFLVDASMNVVEGLCLKCLKEMLLLPPPPFCIHDANG